ncbi:MAG TPA: PEGA domain-containing protein [Caldisericia bacterium]|nr:PEGA domain-containing protein [Caldisericia bacterium]
MPILIVLTLVFSISCSTPINIDFAIETLPVGASITVSGKYVGKTPKTVSVSPGSNIIVELEGYESASFSYSDLSYPRDYRWIELNRLYKVQIDYQPEGTEVYRNGELLGKTPLEILLTKGQYEIVLKFIHHEDLVFELVVDGNEIATGSLTPEIMYFPETVCEFATTPPGALIESYIIEKDAVADTSIVVGTTPLNIKNSELPNLDSEKLFVISSDGHLPTLVVLRGSVTFDVKLPEVEDISGLSRPTSGISTLDYSISAFQNSTHGDEFNVQVENDLLTVKPSKYGGRVSIKDIETSYSKLSGIASINERFFAVRFMNGFGNQRFILYDTIERRRVRFFDVGLYHEQKIPGKFVWGERTSVKSTIVDEFVDFAVDSSNENIYWFKVFDGFEFWFAVESDTQINTVKPMVLEY